MHDDHIRKKLLAQYVAALVEEHACWERLSDPQLSEVERFMTHAKWKPAAERLKALSHELRAAPPQSVPLRASGQSTGPAA